MLGDLHIPKAVFRGHIEGRAATTIIRADYVQIESQYRSNILFYKPNLDRPRLSPGKLGLCSSASVHVLRYSHACTVKAIKTVIPARPNRKQFISAPRQIHIKAASDVQRLSTGWRKPVRSNLEPRNRNSLAVNSARGCSRCVPDSGPYFNVLHPQLHLYGPL